MLTHNVVFDQLLFPAIHMFFLVAGVCGMALGAALIVLRGKVVRSFSSMNRWVSGRQALAPLESPHDIDSIVYKYRRWFSAFFIIGAAFSMVMLFARLGSATVLSVLGANSFSSVGPWLVESLGWMMLTGSVLAIVIGIILGFFPRFLVALELRANHWYSSRQAGRGADKMVLTLDRWVEASPRTAGWLIATAALALTCNSAIVLLGHHWLVQ